MAKQPSPNMSRTSSKPAIIVISSHVARGSVGNRAAVFALEVLGHSVWAIPTIILPWHPGHGPATRIVPDEKQFDSFLKDIAASAWLGEVGAILTGYMANPEQAIQTANLIETLKTENPDLIHVCDPVIGDHGGLYVSEETASGIRDHVLPQADIATPNRFELEWLSGKDQLEGPMELVAAARTLAPSETLITSFPGLMANNIANCLVGMDGTYLAEHREISNPPNGLGDLTAAVFLANRLAGFGSEKALARTTSSVFEILAGTTNSGSNELTLETHGSSLIRPTAMIQTRMLQERRTHAKTSSTAGKKTRPVLKPQSL